jgi:hypothetical protein
MQIMRGGNLQPQREKIVAAMEYRNNKYSVRPEGLHYVVTVTVHGVTYSENVRSRTLGLTGPISFAQAAAYAHSRIDGLLASAGVAHRVAR